jgi:hypothetical protein
MGDVSPDFRNLTSLESVNAFRENRKLQCKNTEFSPNNSFGINKKLSKNAEQIY